MVRVEFLGPIGLEPIEVEASTLKELADILQKNDALTDWLSSAAVAVNDTLTSDLSTLLQAGDRVSLLPPVCGG